MAGKLRKTFGLIASMALAGAMISGSAASAQSTGSDPWCWSQIANQCEYSYSAWGYGSPQQCAERAGCLYCPRDGHTCFEIDWIDDDEIRPPPVP